MASFSCKTQESPPVERLEETSWQTSLRAEGVNPELRSDAQSLGDLLGDMQDAIVHFYDVDKSARPAK